MNYYRITPLEKKNVEYFLDVFERLPDGSIRGFDVTEVWRWGQGFREEDDYVMDYEADISRMHGVHCDPQVGGGCELDDLVAVYVNFSDGFTEEEREEIEAMMRGEKEDEEGRWGAAWIFDGDHNWEVEDNHVRILPPLRIDLVSEDGIVLQDNCQPQS